MNCCVKCFNDYEIQSIIGTNTKGKCDLCSKNNVYVCDITTNQALKESFERLLETYTPITDMDQDFPRDKADLLKNILANEWSIFNLKPGKIYSFLVALLPEKYEEEPNLFDSCVGIKGSVQKDYLTQYSILGTSNWEDFVREIKTSNRFHTAIINKEILQNVLRASCKNYRTGAEFYRARIWTKDVGFDKDSIGAPPAGMASAGRANPEGISCLYLANSIKTTLHETRAGLYDFATVGKFILNDEIQVVDLSEIDKLSPFNVDNIDLLAANLENLKKIGYEISRPVRKHDSRLDYLPTQYICDYIKSIGFDGIQYKSTMCTDGINLAVFDENKFSCVETYDFDINSINYDYKPVEE